MADVVLHEVGIANIDGKRYRIVRKDDEIAYSREYVAEPPYDKGVPAQLSEQQFTWHLGGFKSRQGITGSSEYGINTDGRWPFRLVPGPYLNTATLPGNTSAIRWIWPTSILGSISGPAIWATAGNVAYILTSDSLGQPIFGGNTYDPIMGLKWQSYYLMTDSNSQLWKMALTFSNSANNFVMSPTGAGATTQFTPSTGANWQNVDEISGADDVDATYNSDSVAGHIDLFTKTALSGPAAPDQIYSVTIDITARRTSTGGTNPTMRGVVRIGGVNYFTAAITLTNDTSYHVVTFAAWTLSPATGVAWTIAELDAAQFGYELTVAPGAGVIRVTAAELFSLYANWSRTDARAYWIAAGPRRLFKVWINGNGDVELKNLAPGLDPTVEANWADQVIIPGATITGCVPPLVAYGRTAIVATDTGIYGIDEDGGGLKVFERLETSPYTMAVQDPWLYISHSHGISRWVPGYVQDCGLEQEILNASPVTGIVKAFAFIGPWVFASLHPPSANAQIIVGRERRDGEQGFGPLVWDTLIETGNNEDVTALRAAHLTSTFGLAFEKGNDLGYVIFPETGGVPDIDNSAYRFVVSGTRYSIEYRFDDWQSKNLQKIRIKGKGLGVFVKWSVAYSIDGEAYVTVDGAGHTMEITDDTLHEFFINSNASGAAFRLRFTYASNNNAAKGEITYYEPLFVPQVRYTPTTSFMLNLEYGQAYDSTVEDRTAAQQLSDLATLNEAAPVSVSGPWGDSLTAYVRNLSLEGTRQEASGEYSFLVRVTLQERESA